MAYPACSVKLTSTLTGVNYSSETAVPLDDVVHDTHSFYDPCDPGKFVIPAGFGGWGIYVEFYIAVDSMTGTADGAWQRIRHADACGGFIGQQRKVFQYGTAFGVNASRTRNTMGYAHHSVTVGDQFFLYFYSDIDTSQNILAGTAARMFLMPPYA
jgi:hypothetical protein